MRDLFRKPYLNESSLYGRFTAFIQKHRLKCNNDITVGSFLHDQIEGIFKDLCEQGFAKGIDFSLIAVTDYCMEIGTYERPKEPHDVDVGVKWLKVDIEI